MHPNLITATMKNGLILGALFSINFLFSASHNPILALLTYAVIATILTLTYRSSIQFRDKECGGYITYGQSFLFILFSFFFASLVSSLVKYVYLQFINPDFLTTLYNETMLALEKFKFMIQEEDIEQSMKIFLNPALFSLQFIWMNSFLGAIVGVFMAAFIKKEKSLFDK